MKPTTKSSENKEINPVDFWNEVFEPEDKIEQDAQMLMFGFLSEIEKFSALKGFTRKELAKRIGTSPSYLTQVWRGDKPLNFVTIARFQQVLNITFQIASVSSTEEINVNDEKEWYNQIKKFYSEGGHWVFVAKKPKGEKSDDFYNLPLLTEFSKKQTEYEAQAIPA
jgi:transcriptional regulator with XRE-family HTH domain